jgi:hypothetical protein
VSEDIAGGLIPVIGSRITKVSGHPIGSQALAEPTILCASIVPSRCWGSERQIDRVMNVSTEIGLAEVLRVIPEAQTDAALRIWPTTTSKLRLETG